VKRVIEAHREHIAAEALANSIDVNGAAGEGARELQGELVSVTVAPNP
jgi:hypothetical protein